MTWYTWAKRPRVEIGGVGRREDRIHVRIEADHPREKPTVVVLFSGYDGEIDPFELPRSGRRMHLVVPASACEVEAGPVALRALIDTRGLGAVSPEDVRWAPPSRVT